MQRNSTTGRYIPDNGLILKTCIRCGASKQVWRSEQGTGHYCSLGCYLAARRERSLAERFWSKVDKNGPVPEHRPELGPCWIWTGDHLKRGYGLLSFGRGPTRKRILAHRISWELHYGRLPEGKPFVCHTCDNPPCCRPDHLFAGSDADNQRDMVAKGRNQRGDNHWSRRMPNRVARGVSKRDSKLTEDEVRAIRTRHATKGDSYRVLSQEYGISSSAIQAIVNRRNWKHLT